MELPRGAISLPLTTDSTVTGHFHGVSPVALTGMGYNTWRNEKTEINHNVRAAAFETLKNLGEAQTIVEYAHFKKDRTRATRCRGGDG